MICRAQTNTGFSLSWVEIHARSELWWWNRYFALLRSPQLALTHISPRAFRVLLGAAGTGREVLDAVHVQSPASVARWKHSVTLFQSFHSRNHLGSKRPIVFVLDFLDHTSRCRGLGDREGVDADVVSICVGGWSLTELAHVRVDATIC
jgi:hypothetical protein